MSLALGSVLLSLLNLGSAALIAENRRAGWIVAIAAQVPWTWYDLWTRQLGFLLLSAIYVPVYLRGWRRAAAHPRRPPAGTAVASATGRSATLERAAVVTCAHPVGSELASQYRRAGRHLRPPRRGQPAPTWV